MNEIFVFLGSILLTLGISFFHSGFSFVTLMDAVVSSPGGALLFNDSAILSSCRNAAQLRSLSAGVTLTGMCMIVTDLAWRD